MNPGSPPRISVVIPTYNCDRFVGDAVASVLSQTYPDFEVIVVDDGSTDRTADILRGHREDDRLRYLRQDNRGPGAARNEGIRSAAGEFVTLLDSDDLLCDGCLAAIGEFLAAQPQVGFLFTNYDIFDDAGTVSPSGVDTWQVFRTIPHLQAAEGWWIFTQPLSKYIIQYGGFMHTSGTTIRRSLFDEVGGFTEGFSYGEDDELYARVAYHTISGYVDRVLTRKRNHRASLIHEEGKRLRNAKHFLDLTEQQLAYFRHDMELSGILSWKAARLAHDYCWALQSGGRLPEARRVLLHYLARFKSRALFALLIKNLWLSIADPLR